LKILLCMLSWHLIWKWMHPIRRDLLGSKCSSRIFQYSLLNNVCLSTVKEQCYSDLLMPTRAAHQQGVIGDHYSRNMLTMSRHIVWWAPVPCVLSSWWHGYFLTPNHRRHLINESVYEVAVVWDELAGTYCGLLRHMYSAAGGTDIEWSLIRIDY
jgi:hypothetical protein